MRCGRVEVPWSPDLIDLVRACESSGIVVIGSDAATIARLVDPAALTGLGDRAGVAVDPVADLADKRVLEVDTLTDAAGTTWTLGVREVSVVEGGELLLAEFPAIGLADDGAALEEDARRLSSRPPAAKGRRSSASPWARMAPPSASRSCPAAGRSTR